MVDSIRRRLRTPDQEESEFIVIRGSRRAHDLADYWNAVKRVENTGNASHLRRFRGRGIIDVNGTRHEYVTDVQTLRRHQRAGLHNFDDIY